MDPKAPTNGFIHLDQLLPPLVNEEFNQYYFTLPGQSDSYITQVGDTPVGFGSSTMLKKVLVRLYEKYPDGTVDVKTIETKPFPKLAPESEPVVSRRGTFKSAPMVYLDKLKEFFNYPPSNEAEQIFAALVKGNETEALRLTRHALNVYNESFDDVVLSVFAKYRIRVVHQEPEAKAGGSATPYSMSEISEGSTNTLKVQNLVPQGLISDTHN